MRVYIVWGDHWQNQNVLTHCDNQSAVDMINAGYSRDACLMHLFHCQFFITAQHLRATHIPEVANVAADAISRDNLIFFHSHVPAARPSPTPLHKGALALLVHQQPDWTDMAWCRLFKSCLQLD